MTEENVFFAIGAAFTAAGFGFHGLYQVTKKWAFEAAAFVALSSGFGYTAAAWM